MGKIKVLIVEDQVLFAESLAAVLETRYSDIEVIGVRNSGIEAIEAIGNCIPDIILMDVRMPGMNGVECTKRILEKNPDLRIMMLTIFDDDEYVVEALSLGAVGYLLKDVPPTELVVSIRAAIKGGIHISPKIAEKLVVKMIQSENKLLSRVNLPSIPVWLNELTIREREILQLVVGGFNNKEIAQRLYIAEQTVKNHVSMIYSKMGVHDRMHALHLAVHAGFRTVNYMKPVE